MPFPPELLPIAADLANVAHGAQRIVQNSKSGESFWDGASYFCTTVSVIGGVIFLAKYVFPWIVDTYSSYDVDKDYPQMNIADEINRRRRRS